MSDQATRLTTALSGSYRIDREVGAGGMATDYLAHDLKHDRKVAQTCSTRCPNKIDIAGVMDVLRQMQRESKTEGGEPKVSAFHEAFLDSIKNKGRVHELTMIGNYTRKSGDWREKLKTRSWKNEARLGMKMFIRGKLKLLSPACKKVKEVRNLFEKAEAHKKV